MFIISINIDWFPIYCGSSALIGLLNTFVVGLGSPAPISVDLI